MIYESFNENNSVKIAETIAKKSSKHDIITLSGDLGSGKTFFTNAFVNFFLKRNCLHKINVTSPTFNILKIYNVGDFDIYHFDLYRIKSKSELLEFDFDSAFDNISIIEWPELAMDILPKYFVKNINIKIKKNYRVFEIN